MKCEGCGLPIKQPWNVVTFKSVSWLQKYRLCDNCDEKLRNYISDVLPKYGPNLLVKRRKRKLARKGQEFGDRKAHTSGCWNHRDEGVTYRCFCPCNSCRHTKAIP